jgi:hypothetical protein
MYSKPSHGQFGFRAACFVVVALLLHGTIDAGMPSPIPVFDGPGKPTNGEATSSYSARAAEQHLQAVSFFVACLFGVAWLVKVLWNALRKDLPALPPIGFGRALSFVVLWGLLFVIVLTMISGARELMTPGAWRKQGWTYTLAEASSALPRQDVGGVDERRAALERLRMELLLRAAQEEGRFPAADSAGKPAGIDPALWVLPGWPGLQFLYVADRQVELAGRLLAFEPQVTEGERLVLLTNGAIATMTSADIERALQAPPSEGTASR